MPRFSKKMILLICSLFILTSFQCKDEFSPVPEGYEMFYLLDYTGLDGCTWVLENENGEKFEPENLVEFNITFYNNKKYFVKYVVVENQASICMVGKIINLLDIIDPSTE